MKNRIAAAALVALIGGAFVTPAFAGPPAMDPDITRQEVATFDAYLDQHPALARQLQANPGLVDNEEFVEHHPDFAGFIRAHPRVREELREHPGQFVYARDHFEWSESVEWSESADAIPTDQAAALDRYLDNHRDVAEALRLNTGLVRNDDFMEEHPTLAQFLENHPNLRGHIQGHPGIYMRREGHYQWAEERAPRGGRGPERHADRR
jgi:hypothetical protein